MHLSGNPMVVKANPPKKELAEQKQLTACRTESYLKGLHATTSEKKSRHSLFVDTLLLGWSRPNPLVGFAAFEFVLTYSLTFICAPDISKSFQDINANSYKNYKININQLKLQKSTIKL